MSGEPQITSTHSHPKMEELVKKLLNAYDFYGHIIIQIIEDSAGDLHIIECNARFGGASTLSIAVGLDSFYWFLLEAQGVDVDSYPFSRSMQEKRQIRGATDLVIELK